jgi:AraC family transcriptional regulator
MRIVCPPHALPFYQDAGERVPRCENATFRNVSSRSGPGRYAPGVSSRVLFTSTSVRIGAFASRPTDPDFDDSGPTRGHLLVFPKTCVSIQHADRPTIVADPTVVMIYNRGQVYTRRVIAPAGDHCTWFAFDADTILDARGDRDGDRARPFGTLMSTPSSARMYFAAHAALRHLDDPLAVEEASLSLLDHTLATPPTADVAPAHRELADATRRLLAQRFADRDSLQAIAATLGTSAFHLARVFRRATGRSLHAHRTELRIRAAIARLPDTDDLAALAVDLGFSSHSHFTAAFRKHVGVAPSQARRARI